MCPPQTIDGAQVLLCEGTGLGGSACSFLFHSPTNLFEYDHKLDSGQPCTHAHAQCTLTLSSFSVVWYPLRSLLFQAPFPSTPPKPPAQAPAQTACQSSCLRRFLNRARHCPWEGSGDLVVQVGQTPCPNQANSQTSYLFISHSVSLARIHMELYRYFTSACFLHRRRMAVSDAAYSIQRFVGLFYRIGSFKRKASFWKGSPPHGPSARKGARLRGRSVAPPWRGGIGEQVPELPKRPPRLWLNVAPLPHGTCPLDVGPPHSTSFAGQNTHVYFVLMMGGAGRRDASAMARIRHVWINVGVEHTTGLDGA